MCRWSSTPRSPNFVSIAFAPLLSRVSCEQTLLAPARVPREPLEVLPPCPSRSPSIPAALGISGCLLAGDAADCHPSGGGLPRFCACPKPPVRTGRRRRCRHGSCCRRYPLGCGSLPAGLGMDIEEMTSLPTERGRAGGDGRSLAARTPRKDVRAGLTLAFLPLTRPLFELPNLPVPAALAVPSPASSGDAAGHSQLQAEAQAGSFGSFSRQRLSPHPLTLPAMPGSSRRKKVGARLGITGRE